MYVRLSNRSLRFTGLLLAGVLSSAACGTSPSPLPPPAEGEPQYGRARYDAPRDVCTDLDGDGVYTECNGKPVAVVDCDDRDPARYPGAEERCNGKDDDCDDATADADGASCDFSCTELADGGCDRLKKVVASGTRACALTEVGRVLCWAGPAPIAGTAKYVPGIEGAEDIVLSSKRTCVRKGSEAICWDDKVLIPTAFPLSAGALMLTEESVCSAADGKVSCAFFAGGHPADPETASHYLLDEAATYRVSASGYLFCTTANKTYCHAWFSKGDDFLTVKDYATTSVPSIGDEVCYVGDAAEGVICDGSQGPLPIPDTAGAVEVSRGGGIGCARDAEGKVSCWVGPNPPATARFAQITTGEGFGCGLTQDGHVLCWGALSGDPIDRFRDYEKGVVLHSGGTSLGACDNAADLANLWNESIPTSVAACDCKTWDSADCLPNCLAESRNDLSDGCRTCLVEKEKCKDGGATCAAAFVACAGFAADKYIAGSAP